MFFGNEPNQKPQRTRIEEILESITSFWGDHENEKIKVLRSYKNSTLAFSLNAAGGDYMTFCQSVDTVEARQIDEFLADMKEIMSA